MSIDMQCTILDLEQGSQEWLKFRQGKIGGSDVSSILGVNPWETPLECWERIAFNQKKEDSPAMQRGRDLEPKAREIINRVTARNYQPIVLQYNPYPFLIASLDGMWTDNEGIRHIIEIKCPSAKTHKIAKEGQIPRYYIPQVVHQCALAEPGSCLYCSWDGESPHVEIVEYKPNKAHGFKQLKKTIEFSKSIINFEPPIISDGVPLTSWRELPFYESMDF